jgi:hypothetical protein
MVLADFTCGNRCRFALKDRTDFAVCIYIKGLEDMSAQLKQLLLELGGNS